MYLQVSDKQTVSVYETTNASTTAPMMKKPEFMNL